MSRRRSSLAVDLEQRHTCTISLSGGIRLRAHCSRMYCSTGIGGTLLEAVPLSSSIMRVPGTPSTRGADFCEDAGSVPLAVPLDAVTVLVRWAVLLEVLQEYRPAYQYRHSIQGYRKWDAPCILTKISTPRRGGTGYPHYRRRERYRLQQSTANTSGAVHPRAMGSQPNPATQ